MRADREPMTWMDADAPALGGEERNDDDPEERQHDIANHSQVSEFTIGNLIDGHVPAWWTPLSANIVETPGTLGMSEGGGGE